jgi:phosphoenolpyruvate carboxylase
LRRAVGYTPGDPRTFQAFAQVAPFLPRDDTDTVGSAWAPAWPQPGAAGLSDVLREMKDNWQFFRTFLSSVEMMMLAKTNLVIARRCIETLVPENLRPIFATIEQEYTRTVAEVLAITGNTGLLSNQPELSRTLGVRHI